MEGLSEPWGGRPLPPSAGFITVTELSPGPARFKTLYVKTATRPRWHRPTAAAGGAFQVPALLLGGGGRDAGGHRDEYGGHGLNK